MLVLLLLRLLRLLLVLVLLWLLLLLLLLLLRLLTKHARLAIKGTKRSTEPSRLRHHLRSERIESRSLWLEEPRHLRLHASEARHLLLHGHPCLLLRHERIVAGL